MNLNEFTEEELRNGFLGTVFADGSIDKRKFKYKNAPFEVTHTSKNLDYLRFKQDLLKRLGIDSKISEHNKKTKEKSYTLFRLYANGNPWFSELRDNIYDSQRHKRFPREYVDKFNLLSLLLMYLDDGTLRVRYYQGTSRIREVRATFCIDRFTLSEVLYFGEWLLAQYGIKTRHYRHSKNMELNRGFRLWMNTENTAKLMHILDPFYDMIPSMNYKFIRYYSM